YVRCVLFRQAYPPPRLVIGEPRQRVVVYGIQRKNKQLDLELNEFFDEPLPGDPSQANVKTDRWVFHGLLRLRQDILEGPGHRRIPVVPLHVLAVPSSPPPAGIAPQPRPIGVPVDVIP
ncbi:unnamed protein product, partial [marine sediment metagenome]